MIEVALKEQLVKRLAVVRFQALAHQIFPYGLLLRRITDRARHRHDLAVLHFHSLFKGRSAQRRSQHHGANSAGQRIQADLFEAVSVGNFKIRSLLDLRCKVGVRADDHVLRAALGRHLPGLGQGQGHDQCQNNGKQLFHLTGDANSWGLRK